MRPSLGRQFGWLWGAYAVSLYGSGLGFGAFALIAIRVLMIVMDLARFAALMTIPVAFAAGALSFWQLLAVSAIVAAAKIVFTTASGAPEVPRPAGGSDRRQCPV